MGPSGNLSRPAGIGRWLRAGRALLDGEDGVWRKTCGWTRPQKRKHEHEQIKKQ